MGVGPVLVDAVYNTPSEEILDISLIKLDGETSELEEAYLYYLGPQSVLEEWREARCGENGSAKVCHRSGGIVLLRAE